MCIRDRERIQKAGLYFTQKLAEELLPETKQIPFLSDNKGVIKTALEYLENLQKAVSYTHLRAHETVLDIVCRLLLEKKKKTTDNKLSYCNEKRYKSMNK